MLKATFVPSYPYLIPANNFPFNLGIVSTCSSFHSFSDIADFWLYWIHSPKRWILKSISSSLISACILRSETRKPRLGFVWYHKSLSLIFSACLSILHSAQPVSSELPKSVFSLNLVNTVPLEIGVGGVPV